ncbi:hypothetical protein [Streptosporangium sp. LJ11]|uniref:hypothetical protein n=1 Tax=Streptosporangium sp. LJ11 TaxID=3436927 RepID=UPI003F7AE2FC
MVAAHLRNALDHPDLYRVMFDANLELEDLKAADATLEHLVQAVERGRKADRFRADTDPLEPAIQSRWSRGRSCPAPPEGVRPARAEVPPAGKPDCARETG